MALAALVKTASAEAISTGHCYFVFIKDFHMRESNLMIRIKSMFDSSHIEHGYNMLELDFIFRILNEEANKAKIFPGCSEQILELSIVNSRRNLHIVLYLSNLADLSLIQSQWITKMAACALGGPCTACIPVAPLSWANQILKNKGFETNYHYQKIGNSMTTNTKFYCITRIICENAFFAAVNENMKLLQLNQPSKRIRQGANILQQYQIKADFMKKCLDSKLKAVKNNTIIMENLITKVPIAKINLEQQVEQVEKDEVIAAQLRRTADLLADEAISKMEEVKYARKCAKDSLDCFTKQSICEVKALGKPTQPIQDVFRAVLLLRGDNSAFTWNKALKMMGNPMKFVEELQNYKIEQIENWMIQELSPILQQPYFNFQYMQRHNLGASYICGWVVNIVKSSSSYKALELLMRQQQITQVEAETKENEIALLREKIKNRIAAVEIMEKKLQMIMTAGINIKKEAFQCFKKLMLARRSYAFYELKQE